MAGSYEHCVTDDGAFRFDLIENMGDAYEACEDMVGIIGELAAEARAYMPPHLWPWGLPERVANLIWSREGAQ